MDGLGVGNSGFGVIEKGSEMCSDQVVEKVNLEVEHFVKDEAVEAESLGGLGEENGGFGAVVKEIEISSDDFVEKVEIEEGKGGGVRGKLREIGCSIELETGKFCWEGVLNDSVGAGSSAIMNVELVDGEENRTKSGAEKGGFEEVNSDQLVNVAMGVPENVGKPGDIVNVNGDEARKTEVSDEDESESNSESESGSSSSSSSSSDPSSSEGEDEEEGDDEEEGGWARERKKDKDNEEGQVEREIDTEEGEITESEADDMIAWSDEDDENSAGGNSMAEPIRSKNEITVLPLVPPVNVNLLPHYQTLPVGIVSSILGAQVIVEGVEKHNPLNEGSIIWITETRSPLGLVDEIFGPVKNPYYIVRYNSESEIPTGIKQGTLVSFVSEFANHVLNNESLYKKGYDTSNENDEELGEDVEFSDDEKEAEYRRMQKMKKRGTNDEKLEKKKKEKKKLKNRFGVGKHEEAAYRQAQGFADKPPVHQDQHFVQTGAASSFSDVTHVPASGPALSHPFAHLGQASGFNAPSSSTWSSGVPCQQIMGLPSGLQMQGMPWLQQNLPQQVLQTLFPTGVPFPQQINIGPGSPSNLVLSGPQSNFGAGPAFATWPPGVAQNVLNQPPFGMGIQGQPPPPFINIGENALPADGSRAVSGYNLQPTTNDSGKNEASGNFNPGRHFGGGRKSQPRGGGYFRGGRGRHQPT